MSKTLIIALALLCILTESPTFASGIHGRFDLNTGHYEHPLGLSYDTPAGYLGGALILNSSLNGQRGTFKLGYQANLTRFSDDADLGSRRHALGLEWYSRSGSGSNGLSAGIQVSNRGHESVYEIYDYIESYSYLSFKHYLNGRTLGRGYVALRYRDYGDLPEESYIEPHGRLEFQRYSEQRTTLGLSLSYGRKTFHESAALRVWETQASPASSQLATRLTIAQGFSERVALRGWASLSWNLSGFPHYVADDIFDSPLLDHYAYDGEDAGLVLKILGPVQTWIEFGGSWGRHDYGELIFADGADGSLREDTVVDVFCGLKRTMGDVPGRPSLRFNAGWRQQESDIVSYDYSGINITSSISWSY
jgi:hypothetical protein